ncbi:MAG: hypothetical protein RR416_01430 [Clostridia bacterium]
MEKTNKANGAKNAQRAKQKSNAGAEKACSNSKSNATKACSSVEKA